MDLQVAVKKNKRLKECNLSPLKYTISLSLTNTHTYAQIVHTYITSHTHKKTRTYKHTITHTYMSKHTLILTHT